MCIGGIAWRGGLALGKRRPKSHEERLVERATSCAQDYGELIAVVLEQSLESVVELFFGGPIG